MKKILREDKQQLAVRAMCLLNYLQNYLFINGFTHVQLDLSECEFELCVFSSSISEAEKAKEMMKNYLSDDFNVEINNLSGERGPLFTTQVFLSTYSWFND